MGFRLVSLSIVLILALAGESAAAVIDIAWDDCGAFGSQDRVAACANTGADLLVISLTPPDGAQRRVVGMLAVGEFQIVAPTLSPWWQMKSGGCRPTSFSAQFAFPAAAHCTDPWAGQAIAACNYDYGVGSGIPEPNRAMFRVAAVVPEEFAFPLAAGTTYGVTQLRIDHAKSSGAGACAGCLDAGCFSLGSVQVIQPVGAPEGDRTYYATNQTRVATWNGGAATCVVTPIRERTWGSVKALYR